MRSRSAARACSPPRVEVPDAKALLELLDRVKGRLGDAAIVLGHRRRRPRAPGRERRPGAGGARRQGGSRREGRRRGRRRRRRRARHDGPGGRARPASEARRRRDRGARADARDGDRRRPRSRAMRCGCWRSTTAARAAAVRSAIPRGTIVTPIEAVARPATRRGLAQLRELVREREVRARDRRPAAVARRRATPSRRARRARSPARSRGASARTIPVEMHDERFTTRIAQRMGHEAGAGRSFTTSEDSRAAAHLLESWLAAQGRVRVLSPCLAAIDHDQERERTAQERERDRQERERRARSAPAAAAELPQRACRPARAVGAERLPRAAAPSTPAARAPPAPPADPSSRRIAIGCFRRASREPPLQRAARAARRRRRRQLQPPAASRRCPPPRRDRRRCSTAPAAVGTAARGDARCWRAWRRCSRCAAVVRGRAAAVALGQPKPVKAIAPPPVVKVADPRGQDPRADRADRRRGRPEGQLPARPRRHSPLLEPRRLRCATRARRTSKASCSRRPTT